MYVCHRTVSYTHMFQVLTGKMLSQLIGTALFGTSALKFQAGLRRGSVASTQDSMGTHFTS